MIIAYTAQQEKSEEREEKEVLGKEIKEKISRQFPWGQAFNRGTVGKGREFLYAHECNFMHSISIQKSARPIHTREDNW